MPGYLGGMFSHTTELRVRYGETDKMGYVYYGDYAEYFEVGRVEALRSLGFPYKRLEEEGVMLPVREMQVRYHRAAGYDDRLTLRTTIVEPPSVRITFRNELFDEDGGLIAEATITLVFVDADTRRPRKAPSALLQALASYFS
jgi:acyl-CoA thioester hydrolase